MNHNRISVLIIDDETLARDLIAEMLKNFDNFIIVGGCADGKSAVEAIVNQKPDLIFLDVQMPLLNGFEVLGQIKDKHLPEIIFVTAFDRYAVKAFEFHAIDYLLKPYSPERFREAVSYAIDRISRKTATVGEREMFASLIESYQNKSARLQRIFVRDRGKIILVAPEKIHWIEADDKYLKIHTAEKNYLIRQTLNALEAELEPQNFLRIHRSTIVNLSEIKEIHPLFSGEYLLLLQNGAKLTLSRNYKDGFFARFSNAA